MSDPKPYHFKAGDTRIYGFRKHAQKRVALLLFSIAPWRRRATTRVGQSGRNLHRLAEL